MAPSVDLGAGRKKKSYATGPSTTNCDFIPLLIPAQLRSPRPSFNPWPSPIHSSTKAFDSRQFFFPDFEEIYEPLRSDGLADSLGSRASQAARKIVPYVYLKPYTRRALLVISLISIIPIYRDLQFRFECIVREFMTGRLKLAVNIVYKMFRILWGSLTTVCTTDKWLQRTELISGNLCSFSRIGR